jgi:hypothetical protein
LWFSASELKLIQAFAEYRGKQELFARRIAQIDQLRDGL